MDVSVKTRLSAGFRAAFGTEPQRFFSAPGRTEIGGNHTDHQRGRVLAAAVELQTCAAVALTDGKQICVQSQGYPLCRVDLGDLTPNPAEYGTTAALIRGVAAKFAEMGCTLGGFDAYVESNVLSGSGLSSSAAFEVLMGTILNILFFEGKANAEQVAMVGQYAENVFFGKPCGLMDQMASSVGNLVTIDFFHQDAPDVRPVDVDFASFGHALCIIDTGADHADLTDAYAAITRELSQLCAFFGKEHLRQIPEDIFMKALPRLRGNVPDRAILRAIHVYQENRRVIAQKDALAKGNIQDYLTLVQASGRSSWMYLQNICPAGAVDQQPVALALALCDTLLEGKGAFRVHGGGFAGTVQAYVPLDQLEHFTAGMESVLGKGCCKVVQVRNIGGTQLSGI